MATNNSLVLLAVYNQHMNESFIRAANALDPKLLTRDQGAFFGSVLGTLNHLMVGDIIWLSRFRQAWDPDAALDILDSLPKPHKLNDALYTSLEVLAKDRFALDKALGRWVDSLNDDVLAGDISYHNTKGIAATKPFYPLLQHLFNHQTHHRGQISTLLSQQGVDVGVTDLLTVID